MKAATTLFTLLLATAAFAQDPPEPAQDYSRPTLLRIVVEAERESIRGLRFEDNAVRFTALGTRWSFPHLFLPFVGARFTTTREWPDAFSLTNTPIAYRPGTYPGGPTRREISRELKRIDRVTKATVKVKTKTD